jgi:hypothetical protein
MKGVPEGQVDGLVNIFVECQNLGFFKFEITAATASGGDINQFSANCLLTSSKFKKIS